MLMITNGRDSNKHSSDFKVEGCETKLNDIFHKL
jgi:hypothetical protein